MRHLFIIVDMSRAMEEADLKPSRLACSVKVHELTISDILRVENNMQCLSLVLPISEIFIVKLVIIDSDLEPIQYLF